MAEKLIHLLKPKEFRVWCRPNDVPGDFDVTTKPSKANCSNCLTYWRGSKTGKYNQFKVSHTEGRKMPWEENPPR